MKKDFKYVQGTPIEICKGLSEADDVKVENVTYVNGKYLVLYSVAEEE